MHFIDNSDLVEGETSTTIPLQVVVMTVLANAFFFRDFVRVKSIVLCTRMTSIVAACFPSIFTISQSWGATFDGQTLNSCFQIEMHCYQIPNNSTTTSCSWRLLNLIDTFGIITRLVCKVHGIRHYDFYKWLLVGSS